MYCMKCIVCITISQTNILFSHPQQKINLVKEHEKLAKKSNKKTTIIKKKKDTATTTKKNTPIATPTKRKVVAKKKQRGKVFRTARRNSSGFEMLSQAAELHELQSSTLIAKIGVSSSEPPKYYTAKDNDTPLGIAKTFEVPIYKLIRANKERYPSLLSRSRLIAGTLIQVSHLDKPVVETKLVKVKVTVGSTSKKKKQKKNKLPKKKNTATNDTVVTSTRSSRRITVDKKSSTSLEDTAAVQEDIDYDDADATTCKKMDTKIDDIPNDSISDKDDVPQEVCAASTSFVAGNRGETFDSGCTTATSTNEDESEAAEDYRLFNEEVLNFNWNEQAAMPQAQQGHNAAAVSHDSAVTNDDQAAPQLFSHHNPMVSYNKSVYDQILATLTARPDFNNTNEYQIKNDGLTRTALSAPALMRSRIKSILHEHLSSAWWKNIVLKSSSINECSHRVETLVALAVIMHDNPTWTCVGNTDVVDTVFTADNFTTSMFDDEDEVLCISQMFANVWERVDRSLSRDNFSMLGVDGLQRGSAMRRVMKTLVASAHMIISGLA